MFNCPAVVQTHNLSKAFAVNGKDLAVLKAINFQVFPACMTAIIGTSGSGKSTLLNILGCLDTPSAGSYWLAGQEVSLLREDELAKIRRESIGFVFQKFNLINSMSVVENVLLPQLYLQVPRVQAKERALALLDLVGLSERADFLPAQLSGGQQQRVCIARALVNEPAIILADEPTGGLDMRTGDKIFELFAGLQEKLGITVILVTHDMKIASQAKFMWQLNQGILRLIR